MHRLTFLTTILLMFIFPATHAQVSQEFDDLFNSMGNVTKPGVHVGARRGVIAGGNVSLRTRVHPGFAGGIYSVRQPGVVNAGCGGIDLYGGSLSFISADEFEKYLEAVATNAGYAFVTGLMAMCDSCANGMQWMEDLMRGQNLFNKSSCEAAELLVDKGKAVLEHRAARSRESAGTVDDRSAANADGSPENASGELAKEDPARLRELTPGNLVWERLREGTSFNWLASSTDESFQEIMSLTGTIIVCNTADPSQSCPQGTSGGGDAGEWRVRRVKPTLSLFDFVYGTRGGVVAVNTLRCDTTNRCWNPAPAGSTAFIGMVSRIEDKLLGDRTGTARTGWIANARYDPENMDEEALAFLSQDTYIQMAITLAHRDYHAATDFAERFAPQIAANLVYETLRDIIDEVGRAMSDAESEGNVIHESVWEMLRQSRQNLQADYRLIQSQAAQHQHVLAYFTAVMQNLPDTRRLNTAPKNLSAN